MAQTLRKVKPTCSMAIVDHSGEDFRYVRNYALLSIPYEDVPDSIGDACVDATYLPFTFAEVSRDIVVSSPEVDVDDFGKVVADSVHLPNPFVQGDVFRMTFNHLLSRVVKRSVTFQHYNTVYDLLVDDEGQPVYVCVDPEVTVNDQVADEIPQLAPIHYDFSGNYLYKHYSKGIVDWNCATTLQYPVWVLEKLRKTVPSMVPTDPALGLLDVVCALFKRC